jgi:hypothetical protein
VEPASLDGTITSIAPGEIVIANKKDSKPWSVYVQPTTSILVTGTADPEFLKVGLTVQFQADLDKDHKAKDSVGELTLVTPSRENPAGIFAPGSSPQKLSDPASAGKAAAKPAEKGGFGGTEPKFGGAGMSRVVGRITKRHDNALTIRAGTKNVSIELAADPKIHVYLTDSKFASVGDSITIQGKEYKGKPGFCAADSVKITLAQPLTEKKKKPAPSKAAKKDEN